MFQDSLGYSFLRRKQSFIHLLKNKTMQEKRKINSQYDYKINTCINTQKMSHVTEEQGSETGQTEWAPSRSSKNAHPDTQPSGE